ncbi:MAG: DUF4143 domain-containing protein [archaeon]|nr:DUF4143 domain-containing protein [archaeon]
MFNVDSVKRNGVLMEGILKTYSRNLSTLAKKTSLIKDLSSPVSDQTFDDYLDVLKKLYLVDEVPGWCPSLRSSAGERSGPKREFVDPSLAVVGLGITPNQLLNDYRTFESVFECICIRDLKVYSNEFNGTVSHYHDRYGLEVDCVLHLDDGRYALIEFKLGSNDIESGAKHLNEVERLIIERNKDEKQASLGLPSVKIVITATELGYRREDGVYVIPVGCLGP